MNNMFGILFDSPVSSSNRYDSLEIKIQEQNFTHLNITRKCNFLHDIRQQSSADFALTVQKHNGFVLGRGVDLTKGWFILVAYIGQNGIQIFYIFQPAA